MYIGSSLNISVENQQSLTTIWLLSLLNRKQLGSSNKGGTNKVTKRDIISISIPKTCSLIYEEEQVLPLKQISHLLYGVSLCYTKKLEFVLDELSYLLNQLQRSLRTPQKITLPRIHKSGKQMMGIIRSTTLENSSIFADDPSFDIQFIENFEEYINKNQYSKLERLEAVRIKKKDFLNELTNYNVIEVTNETDGSVRPLGTRRNLTLEELPIDLDLDLDIGDIISQQGTSVSTNSNTGSATTEILLREGNPFVNSEKDISGLVANPIADFDLDFDQQEGNEPLHRDTIEVYDDCPEPLKRKRKYNTVSNRTHIFPKRIKKDVRISLLTETLKANHENYLDLMNRNRKVINKNRTRQMLLEETFSYFRSTSLLEKCWNFVASTEIDFFLRMAGRREVNSRTHLHDSIDLGRRATNLAETSNIFSEYNQHEPNGIQNDMLLHLDQIEEDLEDEQPMPQEFLLEDDVNFLRMPLNLPPSSLGRNTTRSSSNHSQHNDNDFVDILKMAKDSPEGSFNESLQTDFDQGVDFEEYFNSISRKITSPQGKKIYTYIWNKYKEYGQEMGLDFVDTEKSAFKSLPFNYFIPTVIKDPTTREDIHMPKQLAANAFFSLLGLASQDILDFQFQPSESVPACSKNFAILL